MDKCILSDESKSISYTADSAQIDFYGRTYSHVCTSGGGIHSGFRISGRKLHCRLSFTRPLCLRFSSHLFRSLLFSPILFHLFLLISVSLFSPFPIPCTPLGGSSPIQLASLGSAVNSQRVWAEPARQTVSGAL